MILGCGINYKLMIRQSVNPNLTVVANISVDSGVCISDEW